MRNKFDLGDKVLVYANQRCFPGVVIEFEIDKESSFVVPTFDDILLNDSPLAGWYSNYQLTAR